MKKFFKIVFKPFVVLFKAIKNVCKFLYKVFKIIVSKEARTVYKFVLAVVFILIAVSQGNDFIQGFDNWINSLETR